MNSIVAPASAVKGQGASFDTVEARTEHNVEVAARVMAAGVPVVPLKEQAPLALAFPRLDSTIAPAERAAIVAAWQAEKGHTRAPFHVGSTVDGERLNAWHSGRRDWTLGFGCSPGLVEALVIDCDDEGGASLLAYLESHGEGIDYARTPITVSGGRKGWHVWFANPGGKWGCPKIKPAIIADVKGRGGQVLLPDVVLSPKRYGDTMSGPRHYRPLAGTPDLLDTLRAGALPPLPACLAALMERNGGTEAEPSDERSTHVRAALVALRVDPSPTCMARDAMALVTALRGKDAGFDELWRQGDDDGSNGRFRVAQALVREYGSNGFEVHDLNEAFDEWDHAVKGNPITDREVARCYGKAVENFGARNDGGAFGAVPDGEEGENQAPQVEPQAVKLDGPQALAEMQRRVPFGDDTAGPEAALRKAMNENSLKRAQADTLDKLLGGIRAGMWKPGLTFDGLRMEVLDPLPRGIALPDDEDDFADLTSIPATPWLVYWIASACSRIVAAPMSSIGSIGVVTMHTDVSKAAEKRGIVHTFIHAGKHKVDGHPYAPLPDDVRADIQAGIDSLYDRFAATVAELRGLDVAAVRATEAAVFGPDVALHLGLVDSVGTLGQTLAALVDALDRPTAKPAQALSGGSLSAAEESALLAHVDSVMDLPEAKGREGIAMKLALRKPHLSPNACAGLLRGIPTEGGATAALVDDASPKAPGSRRVLHAPAH